MRVNPVLPHDYNSDGWTDMGGKVAPRAIEFLANAPTDKQPYKPQGDGSTVVLLDVADPIAGEVEVFWRASRGKILRIVAEVQD